MSRRDAFKITEFINPTGTKSYRVTGRIRGRRIRENYPTLEEAQAAKQRREIELHNLPNLPLRQTRLSESQLREAEQAFDRLSGQSLTEAVEFYLENYREPVEPISIEQAVEKFIEAKRLENRRPKTLRNLRDRLTRFAGKYPGKLVHEVLPGDVQAFLSRQGITPQSAHNDRLVLSNFFNWALRHGYTAENPLRAVGRIQVDQEEPSILSVDDCSKLMATAAAFRAGVLVPYVSLSLFAGLRPTEIQRLSWSEVDIEGRNVTIGARIAKMRQRRLVSMSDNLAEWLRPHHGSTAIYPRNWRKLFDALRQEAGLQTWGPDILRHTAVSMHLAYWQNEGQTAGWAGNSPTVIQKHYKGLVKPTDAERFWSIYPPSAENVISFEATS